MDVAERVMVSCLLLGDGAEPDHIRQFLDALVRGLEAGEPDAAEMLDALRKRVSDSVPEGAVGDVIRVMRAIMVLDTTLKRFGMACESLKAASDAVAARPGVRGLAARVLLEKATSAAT